MSFAEGQPTRIDKLSGLQVIDPWDLPPEVVIPRWYHRWEDVQPQLKHTKFLARGVVIGDPHIPGQVSADSLLVDCLPTEPVTCRADYDKLLAKAHCCLTSPRFKQYTQQFNLDPTRLDCQYFFQEQFGRDDRLNIIALRISAGYHFEVWSTNRVFYGSITGDTEQWECLNDLPSLHSTFPDYLKSIYVATAQTQTPNTGCLLEMICANPYLHPSMPIALVQQRQIPNPNQLHGFTYEEYVKIARNLNFLAHDFRFILLILLRFMNETIYLLKGSLLFFPSSNLSKVFCFNPV